MLSVPPAAGPSGMAAASARVQAIRSRLESLTPAAATTRFSLDAQLAAAASAAPSVASAAGPASASSQPAASSAIAVPSATGSTGTGTAAAGVAAGPGATPAPVVGLDGPSLPSLGPASSRPATFAHLQQRSDRPAATGALASGAQAPGALAAKLPAAAQRWVPAIEQAAASVGLDPALLAALVRHESNFDQGVVSHAGAIGLAQLMPGTARGLGVDPHDPIENLTGGARYLRAQLDRFGSVELALAAYNAGPNRVVAAGGVPQIAETQAYVRRVTSTWEQLR
jgi:soluble lytic murein transglycosylase-like protein